MEFPQAVVPGDGAHGAKTESEVKAEMVANDTLWVGSCAGGNKATHERWAEVTYHNSKAEEFKQKNFAITDPSSELYLEYVKNNDMKADLSDFACVCDTKHDRSMLQVSPDESERLETMKFLGGTSNDLSYNYLCGRKLSSGDAEGGSMALEMYIGNYSGPISQEVKKAILQSNLVMAGDHSTQAYILKYGTVIYYLVHALRVMPYYWGAVTRFVHLNDEALEYYVPGNVVTWTQFSSSSTEEVFKGLNTKFLIYSCKGRDLRQFNEKEQEVLFMPFTRLLVLSKTKEGNTNVIKCREVELGITCGDPVLWVDDRCLEPNYENKQLMDQAMMDSGNRTKYILKQSTQLACAFLKSPVATEIVEINPHFRIMSDMSRPNEPNGDEAGAILIKHLLDISALKNTPIMVYTSSVDRGEKKVNKHNPNLPADKVKVTASWYDALSFLSFKDKSALSPSA